MYREEVKIEIKVRKEIAVDHGRYEWANSKTNYAYLKGLSEMQRSETELKWSPHLNKGTEDPSQPQSIFLFIKYRQ